MFFDSFGNCKLNTVIEAFSAGGLAIPSYHILIGKRRMDAWFNDELHSDTVININDSGYTNNEIGVSFLKHFIKHTQSGPSVYKKLLLFDRHKSHESEEFQCLAAANNILLFKFPPHLTHIIQPLDIGCFQLYKQVYKMAVYKAIHKLQKTYSYDSFLRDLSKIRAQTFTEKTVIHSFNKCGLWLSDC
jgi:hypothetical protein